MKVGGEYILVRQNANDRIVRHGQHRQHIYIFARHGLDGGFEAVLVGNGNGLSPDQASDGIVRRVVRLKRLDELMMPFNMPSLVETI